MTNKERLTKYLTSKLDLLNSGVVPQKHATHPETYRAFLQREIDETKRRLEEEKVK